MIHQPLGGAQGQAADIEIQAKEILFIRSLLNSYMAEYCEQPVDKIQVNVSLHAAECASGTNDLPSRHRLPR